MAMSLLYALLGVNDPATLNALAAVRPMPPDIARALKYRDRMTPRERREVRAALYQALYAIVEGAEVNRAQSMAIGKALCNALSGNLQGSLQNDPDILSLYVALKPIVAETIDEI